MIFIIKYLRVSNLALIEHTEIEFEDGFNVLTGETAAGKSLIIDSINMVVGGRAGKHIVRSGSNKAVAEALFILSEDNERVKTLLESRGIDFCEDLVVRREISPDGKSICRINGKIVNLKLLREVGLLLVNIHGQHDNQELLSSENHIGFLDRFACCEEELLHYKTCYKSYCAAKNALEDFIKSQSDKRTKMDFLAFRIDEINSMNLKSTEEEQLESELKKLQFSEKISKASSEAMEYLYSGENSAYEFISKALKSIRSASSYDASLSQAEEVVNGILIDVEEVSSLIKNSTFDFLDSTGNIDEIQARLSAIYNLKIKYAKNVEELIEYSVQMQSEYDLLSNAAGSIATLEHRLDEKKDELMKSALILHRKRVSAAEVLEKSITRQLNDLSMQGAYFKVSLLEREFSENGIDKVEFLISANKGAAPGPLGKIASGGELSRIMLASKAVLADTDDVGTLVFDEIDTGISGKTASLAAEKIAQISTGKQVICITHLAQIACRAKTHFLIKKETEGERVNTRVQRLSYEERCLELARIVGGAEITETAVKHAEELLNLR